MKNLSNIAQCYKDNYEEARNGVQKLIDRKRLRKLTENVGKHKKLWKNLKSVDIRVENFKNF